jgi:hypothetical protein
MNSNEIKRISSIRIHTKMVEFCSSIVSFKVLKRRLCNKLMNQMFVAKKRFALKALRSPRNIKNNLPI